MKKRKHSKLKIAINHPIKYSISNLKLRHKNIEKKNNLNK
jgi:hypothetical protein